MPSKKTKPPQIGLSPEQYLVAEAYCQAAQHLLGLQGWRIEVSREPAHRSNHAEIHLHDEDDLIGQLRFGVASEPWTHERIAMLVVHELLHPFFHGLINAASRGRRQDTETSAQEHRLINVLTPVLTDIVLQMVEFDEEEQAEEVMH